MQLFDNIDKFISTEYTDDKLYNQEVEDLETQHLRADLSYKTQFIKSRKRVLTSLCLYVNLMLNNVK